MRDGIMHIISTEMLLWALGGFAEVPEVEHRPSVTLSALQIKTIQRLAEKEHCAWGESKLAAERVNLDVETLKALVSMARRGHNPAYWRDVTGDNLGQ